MRRTDLNPIIVSLSESHSSEHHWATADSVISPLARRGRWARRRFVFSTFWMGCRGRIKGSRGTRRGSTSFPVQQRRKQICSLPGLSTATCTPLVVPGITNAPRRYPRQHKTHPDIYVRRITALKALKACRLRCHIQKFAQRVAKLRLDFTARMVRLRPTEIITKRTSS